MSHPRDPRDPRDSQDPDDSQGSHNSQDADTPGVNAARGDAAGDARAVRVQQQLEDVAARARRQGLGQGSGQGLRQGLGQGLGYSLASELDWQRQQHWVRVHQRRRARRVWGFSALVAAAVLVTATVAWPHLSQQGSSVRVVSAAPGQLDAGLGDESAQVHPEDPAAVPPELAAMAPGCAYDAEAGADTDPAQREAALAAGAGEQALSEYRTVFAAAGELSQAVALQHTGTGQTWMCTEVAGTGAGVTGMEQFEAAGTLERAWGSLPIGAPDGTYLLDVKGVTGGRITAVNLTTAAGYTFEAVVQGGIWWATPRIETMDEPVTWRAVDAAGEQVATGSTAP
ncbi:hypothetical protein GCM10027586_02210 [Kineococcus gypseus]